MFIYLSKVVPALLLYPPGLTILLLVVATSLRKRMPRFAVGSFIFAVVSLYALSTHAVAEELQRSLESTYPEVSISSVPTADVICGNGQFPFDAELDVESQDLSPGVRRMLALVGSEDRKSVV